jgi:type II secretory ATPase GspE/PulE/Tfp pilus assembly ATPase PilB-like protein
MLDDRIGQLLIHEDVINDNELEQALNIQRQYGGRIGEVLVNQGSCSEEEVLTQLSLQLGLPRLQDWQGIPADSVNVELYDISAEWWSKQKAFPLGTRDNQLWVAVHDVLDVFVLEAVKQITGKKVLPVITGGHELRQLLSLLETSAANTDITDESLLQDLAIGAPIIKFVNDTIQRAMDAHASDIHFESYRGVFRIRFRVDGVLHEVDRPGASMQPAIISRLKLMSELDISETRLPQDGRIRLRVGGTDLDIRVATSPGVAGENIVLRLLISEGGVEKIDDLGMHKDHYLLTKKLLTHTNGIILVTGPTGSGKSTTLYSFLRHLMGDERKIITVEDPVEYQINGITQIPVNTEIGLSFASVLRSVLRQDPDIVMIGEIRDKETAEIAVQAALTGHLVLSTLHTNDAPSAFVRLMDMGVEPYLLASSIIGVLGQRLVRAICPHCSETDEKALATVESLGWTQIQKDWPVLKKPEHFSHGQGCPHCLGSGYRGRRSIFEMLEVDSTLQHLLSVEPEKIINYFSTNKIRTIREDGLLAAAEASTTIEEVLRVTG